MGRLFAEYTISLFPSGLDISIISNLIFSIPGDTSIRKLELDFQKSVWRIEFQNSLFLDGTQIVPKYKIPFQLQTGLLATTPVFDGIDIIDPVTATSTLSYASHPNPGNSIQNVPINITITPYGAVLPLINWTCSGDDPRSTAVCTCGTSKVGGLHSNWCDKKN